MKLPILIAAILCSTFLAREDAIGRDQSKNSSANIVSAIAIHPENWATTADREASGSNEEGTTYFELTVTLAGTVEQCRVVQSSGVTVFDRLTCSLMMQRARFRPAKDQHGQAIASTWANRVKWVRPGHNLSVTPPPADLDVTVSRLPSGVAAPTRVGVLAIIGIDGEPEICVGQSKERGDALNTIACQQIGQTLPRVIARDRDGNARRILRYFSVEFAVSPTSSGGS